MSQQDSRAVDPKTFYTWHGPYPELGLEGGDLHSGDWQNIAAAADQTIAPPNLPIPLGYPFMTPDGRKFRYMQMTGGALAEGQSVTPAAGVGVDVVDSDSTGKIVTKTAGFGATINLYKGYNMTVDDGTGAGQTRRVVGSDPNNLYLERALTTALTTAGTSDVTLWNPFIVIITPITTKTTRVIGVGISTLTEDFFGFVQVGGFCEQHVLDAAPAENGYIGPGAAVAGQGLNVIAAETADDIWVYARAAPGIVVGAGANRAHPVILGNLTG